MSRDRRQKKAERNEGARNSGKHWEQFVPTWNIFFMQTRRSFLTWFLSDSVFVFVSLIYLFCFVPEQLLRFFCRLSIRTAFGRDKRKSTDSLERWGRGSIRCYAASFSSRPIIAYQPALPLRSAFSPSVPNRVELCLGSFSSLPFPTNEWP